MPAKEKAVIEISKEVFKEPLEVIKQMTENFDSVTFTKVIQTYVIENQNINLALERNGNIFAKGKLVWLGNRKDSSEGSIFCFDTGSEMRTITPSPDNTEKVILDPRKDLIKISTASRIKCPVCEKSIEIFDEQVICPVCGAKAHKNHFFEWVKMKKSCPVCKKALEISEDNQIYMTE
ncbi:MAG: E3 ubiquitin protein ligase [Candidatus Lokiarchaeota archaeon]|nr:E3 ubiquitin protein ligase [Candidatus Lokiarchaeota archaeon]